MSPSVAKTPKKSEKLLRTINLIDIKVNKTNKTKVIKSKQLKLNQFSLIKQQQSKANILKFQRDASKQDALFGLLQCWKRRREHEVREQTKIVINLNFRENTNLL